MDVVPCVIRTRLKIVDMLYQYPSPILTVSEAFKLKLTIYITCGCGGMVDTLVLGTSAAMREGSSPFIRTKKKDSIYGVFFLDFGEKI